jgi:hypothetical protein
LRRNGVGGVDGRGLDAGIPDDQVIQTERYPTTGIGDGDIVVTEWQNGCFEEKLIEE